MSLYSFVQGRGSSDIRYSGKIYEAIAECVMTKSSHLTTVT